MKFIDFFAGIGGFRLGMEMAGHECVGFCEWDKFATASYTSMYLITEKQRKHLGMLDIRKRQKEILKEEYRNNEWYSNDIRTVKSENLPQSDCWCFGAPCQDFSIAGKRAGLSGDRSSLIQEIFRMLEERKEEDRPKWIIYENVKGMFSSNRGLDYLSIVLEMDRLGYDIEWQNINSKWFVPQNRERIYTVGHLRRAGGRKVFPIRSSNKEADELSGQATNTITTRTGQANATGTYVVGSEQHAQAVSGVYTQDSERFHKAPLKGLSRCLKANKHDAGVVIPVLTPDRAEKRQNGRRFKEDGDPMFTLTGQENNSLISGCRIRKLTPKECFRLQGFSDEYFERARAVNSDSQLYKQAGNSVTVNVIYEIARRLT